MLASGPAPLARAAATPPHRQSAAALLVAVDGDTRTAMAGIVDPMLAWCVRARDVGVGAEWRSRWRTTGGP